MKNRARFIGIVITAVLLVITTRGYSAAPAEVPAKTPGAGTETSPVVFDGKELFRVRDIKYTPSEKRAEGISKRIRNLAEDLTIPADSITTEDLDVSTDIVSGDKIIMIVLDRDALPEKRTRQELAKDYAERIRQAVERYRVDYSRRSILSGALYALIATIAFILVVLLFRRFFRKLDNLIETRYKAKIGAIHIKSLELVQAQRVRSLVDGAVKVFRISALLFFGYVYLHLLMSFFPWTRPFAGQLLGYLLVPLRVIVGGFLKHIPNILFIAVVVVITRFVLKFMHLFFRQVEQGTITIKGFYPEFAGTTDRLLSLLVIAFAAVVAFPYVPGSDSPAFKGVSIFIGVLFSLGSQSAVSNTIAGMVMTYRRAFKVGDRIQIGEITGDVTEIRLQVTHVRTIKNEEVIVPNSTILSSHITNYSTLSRERGLILHTAVTIGYDAPWRQVHALLLLAAERTEGLLKEPPPFVLQKSLDDFYVRYELNAYTNDSHAMAKTYSDLHQNIQDCFNEYGVQIMSPNYVADRPLPTVVPKEHWYAPPAKPPGDDKGG